ncbi:MAG: signal recognition particle-docking protein FtsY [Gemmatimonadales bacterium]|nr:signal recognition particle-docking protein FtsY [Gemmatimonadales bacterium]NIN50018.1 signal recognition particle-docking protein FtsY [Gemmatimonadales bacterium]NIP07482.1 signal recognition particle-docking protein FtsY [Gemmatimonadales bacterium]NIR03121.1 signal recognition particle-docking protein FtsY [Gemmatimonadales bacterium]NIS66833.1 signal recognition particle-docking protein FtsY [Gemmatimonadales bacterium]
MKAGLWRRIKAVALTDVTVLVRGLDHDTLEQVERILVEADFGIAALQTAAELEQQLRRGVLKTPDAVRSWLKKQIAGFLPDSDDMVELHLGDGAGPGVVLVLGVNGVGKTTFIAKLAHRLMGHGKTVLLAAADTYRAGASEQIREWGKRLGVRCITGTSGGDPAAVAFDAIEAAKARGIDVVLVDTAGRLHTHGDLMDELKKIARVMARRREGAPHESLLVLDGTVGQNALQQGRAFTDAVPVSGLVITKLDGTAKGGSVVRLRHELGIPIKFVGVGERLEDLEVFDPEQFTERLLAD